MLRYRYSELALCWNKEKFKELLTVLTKELEKEFNQPEGIMGISINQFDTEIKFRQIEIQVHSDTFLRADLHKLLDLKEILEKDGILVILHIY